MKIQIRAAAFRTFVAIVLTASLTPSAALANNACLAAVKATKLNVTTAATELQEQLNHGEKVLAYQSPYDDMIAPDGGGSCGPISAANLIQIFRRALGAKTPLDIDSTIRGTFAKMPELLRGRMSNENVARLFQELASEVPGQKVTVRTESLATQEVLSLSALETAPNEMQMITYKVTTPQGIVRGRHFVVVKEHYDDLITVIDPHRPTRDYIYKLEKFIMPNEGGITLRLVRPDGHPTEGRFTFDSVFTISTGT